MFAQLKLNELLAMTHALPHPHPVHAASVCHVFERCAGLFGRYEGLIRQIWREVLGLIYADAHTLDLDGAPLGSCDRHLALEPWFSKYDRVARRCRKLEEQLERGLRKASDVHGAARARDAQLAHVLANWQRELVRVKALAGHDDGAEAVAVTLPVLEAQIAELAKMLAATQRELRAREDELDAALRANAELRVPRALGGDDDDELGGGGERGADAAALAEQIRARFRSLPASAQGTLARELLASVGAGGGPV